MSERLICRFCDKSNWRILFDASTHAQQVECASCLARGPLADSLDNAIAAWGRRAPSAEQHMCRKECVDECLWPDCRHKPADHIKVDGIRVDVDYVRRMRGLLDQRDFTIQRMEAEQQQQEPVGEGLKPVDPALLQPFKAAMQNETIPAIVDAVRQRQCNAAEDRGVLYTHQQPQAQGGPNELTNSVKHLATEFYRWWHNQPGTNTDQGFDVWWDQFGHKFAHYNPRAAVPDGFCIMPRRLTAENGAKQLLIGEFFASEDRQCPVCNGDADEMDICDCCDGEGEITTSTPISWITIKAIYKKIVEHFETSQRLREIARGGTAAPAQPGDAQGGEG